MAEKRMISKSISISEKVNMLPDVFDMLLFTWIIPHTDDFGRLTGSPAKVKALVVPMMDKSIREIERAIKELHDAGLIIWYQVESDKYIQVINFDDHQQGLHKRTRSKHPDPPEIGEIPGTSGNFSNVPSELNRTEGNRTEQNGTEGNVVSYPQIILKLINKYKIECKGTFQLEQICAYIGIFDIEVIESAIKQSENKNVPYAITILERLKKEGKTKKESLDNVKNFPETPGRLDFVDNL